MDRQRPRTTDRDRTCPVRWRPVRRLSAVASLVFLASLAPGTPPAAAATHRLSQGLPFSDVNGSALMSPDGQFAVYRHDAEVDSALELWSVRVAGGAPVRLCGLLPFGVSVRDFQISADSQRVVYIVAQETANQEELYSIPIAGPEGAWIKLNGELPAGSNVLDLQISPDSTRVIYIADQTANNIFDAWTVPIDGGTPDRLRPVVTLAGSSVVTYSVYPISPDGERVIFRADFSDLDRNELWSARVDGTGPVIRLNGTLNAGGTIHPSGFSFSPDSSRVVYRADQESDDVVELYSVPSGGGIAVKLNGLLTSGGDVLASEISPDSTRVIYLADQQNDQKIELYSVPLAGGGVTKLNGALTFDGDVFEALISPNSSRVIYLADQDTEGVDELFSVPLAGGSAVKLNPTLTAGRDVHDLAIAPNSARVVYMADQNDDEVVELFSVPLAGGTSVRVSDDLVFGGDVTSFRSHRRATSFFSSETS